MASSSSDRRAVRVLHVGFAALALLALTNGPSVYAALHWFDGGITWFYWTFTYPFGAVAVVGIVLMARELGGLSRREVPWPVFAVGGYVLWSLASAMWSVSPLATPMLALMGVGIAAFGCWFGWRLTFHEQVWAVAGACSVAVGLSAAVVAFLPDIGRMPVVVAGYGGEWRGIFNNRNSLAPVCVLGIIGLVGVLLARPSWRRGIGVGALVVLHVVVLVGSASDTSYIALLLTAIMAGCVPLVWKVRAAGVSGRRVAAVSLVAVLAAWFAIMPNLDRIATALGRDPTLSRRRLIWDDVRGFIAERPLHGYGYWAFWDRSDLTYQTYMRVGTAYGSAHNSALEVLLGLGAIGFGLYLAIAVASIGGVFGWLWGHPSLASGWWAVLVVFLTAENLTESFVLWHSYIWVLFVAAALVPFGLTARGVCAATDQEGELQRVR